MRMKICKMIPIMKMIGVHLQVFHFNDIFMLKYKIIIIDFYATDEENLLF